MPIKTFMPKQHRALLHVPGITLPDAPVRMNRGEQVHKAKADAKQAAIDGPRKLTLEDIRRLGGEGQQQAPREVKLRFAPSPTGNLHIGSAVTAALNYLAAKRLGGKFLLRIEDTDRERSKEEFIKPITEGLQWLGIEWDEELVFQSKQIEKGVYRQKVDQLVQAGKATRNPDGSVVFHVPKEGFAVVNDRVKGRVAIPIADGVGDEDDGKLKDFIIQKSNGDATFLLANAVDDGEQGVTHVIRGDDHLVNAAKQIFLFRALGYPVPEFFHVPLIHADDGGKLSKRKGAAGLQDFQEMGYDPVVLMNHLVRLGSNFGTQETLPVDELAKRLDVFGFSTGASRIGFDALNSRSRAHIAIMDAGELGNIVVERDPQLAERLGGLGVAALVDGSKTRASTYAEVVGIGHFVVEEPVYREEEVAIHASPEMKAVMAKLRRELAAIPEESFSHGRLSDAIDNFEVPPAAYQRSLRWMLTGIEKGLPLHHTMAVLGRAETLARLDQFVG